MPDERTRNLERAAAQGDVDAEAKLLLERVRAGDLFEERLKLAAYLGHEAAVVALDSPGPPSASLSEALLGLDTCDRQKGSGRDHAGGSWRIVLKMASPGEGLTGSPSTRISTQCCGSSDS